ncbi:GUN4 domain-containing protein [Leptolyngbya sp. CCNP1308]|uniref:NACHT domain-containing protein n=1 Tax=Leptolyngbya sp. CCNP1308 TaxID=3110255 RepID=UPI002B1F8528|nr:GUN4 domain-containing protein [Leptolyngbya sp. CCNP1308]MEA5451321.1 GUN4 domain-containing protein [Leptolyngbya sp. CCNP1308]
MLKQIGQSIVRWSPLGGSALAFASFLIQQDWLVAIVLFPATVISAVWASYSKGFIERLTEIYSERAGNHANVVARWIDSLLEALRWQFSGFEGKYLKLQAKPCQEYDTEGFQPDKTAIPMLEEVFVPLELSGYGAERTLLADGDQPASEGLHIWSLIRRSRQDRTFKQMVIQAQGGFGKTTLMRHIALMYGEGKHKRYKAPKLVPFSLFLRDWRDLIDEKALPPLPDLITQHYLPTLSQSSPLQPSPKWAQNLLKRGEALVMLDGFDELAEGQRPAVSHWISQQMREYSESTFILTSRPAGFKDYQAKPPTAPLFVKKFSPSQQQRFVERWYLCQERCARSDNQQAQARAAAERKSHNLLTQIANPNRPELQEMAQNPLLLNMLATYHRFDPGTELPRRRIELYEGICKLQLDDRPRARGISMLLPYTKSPKVLQDLALAMVKENRPTLTETQTLNFFSKHPILHQEQIASVDFLKQMVQVSELLVEREKGHYEFPHLSFQGYFAAGKLDTAGAKGLDLLLENWSNAWWRETILLYTAQLSPGQLTKVIRHARDLGRDAAQLAYDCLREYRNLDKLDPALEKNLKILTTDVQNLRYQQLEQYLQNGQWRESDNETYRLMITAVGKEEGQYFEPDELLNFPCEELLSIDGLWVQYSQGRFGFSVQKEIYLSKEVGGIADGKYYKEAFERFGDRVDWRENGEWEFRIKYDTSAPKGHLPCCLWGVGFGYLSAVVGILFSRIETCKL